MAGDGRLVGIGLRRGARFVPTKVLAGPTGVLAGPTGVVAGGPGNRDEA